MPINIKLNTKIKNLSINTSQLSLAIDELRKQTNQFDDNINAMMEALEEKSASEKQKANAILLFYKQCEESLTSASDAIKKAYLQVIKAAIPQAVGSLDKVGTFMPYSYKNEPAPMGIKNFKTK